MSSNQWGNEPPNLNIRVRGGQPADPNPANPAPPPRPAQPDNDAAPVYPIYDAPIETNRLPEPAPLPPAPPSPAWGNPAGLEIRVHSQQPVSGRQPAPPPAYNYQPPSPPPPAPYSGSQQPYTPPPASYSGSQQPYAPPPASYSGSQQPYAPPPSPDRSLQPVSYNSPQPVASANMSVGNLNYNASLSVGQATRKDPTIALILELIGFFGLLGIGHIYAGYTARGVGLLIGWLLMPILWIVLVFSSAALAYSTSGGSLIFICLLALALMVVPIVSGIWAKRSVEQRNRMGGYQF